MFKAGDKVLFLQVWGEWVEAIYIGRTTRGHHLVRVFGQETIAYSTELKTL